MVKTTGYKGGEKMTDRLTDLFEQSGVYQFYDNIRPLIEDSIKDLYYSGYEAVYSLQLCHIDRAVFKFREAKEKRVIFNTKSYFKACLKSAIKETGIENLD